MMQPHGVKIHVFQLSINKLIYRCPASSLVLRVKVEIVIVDSAAGSFLNKVRARIINEFPH